MLFQPKYRILRKGENAVISLNEKKYRPEYTQLPFGFLYNDADLQALVREKGLNYLAVYIAIQDRMANHPEEDFTLSYKELLVETESFLQQYAKVDDSLKRILDDMIAAGIVESRMYVSPFTEKECQRYCIPSVADSLEHSREAWMTKVTNRLSTSKVDKAMLKQVQDEIKEIKRKISKLNAAKRNYRRELSAELLQTDCDKHTAQLLNATIENIDHDIACQYRKIHSIQSKAEAFKTDDTESEND